MCAHQLHVCKSCLTDRQATILPRFELTDRRLSYHQVHVYKSSFRAMKHTITGSLEKTLMKLIVHAETDKVRRESVREREGVCV